MDDEAPDVATCADSDAVVEALFESAAVAENASSRSCRFGTNLL
jgi:hypothetical protein